MFETSQFAVDEELLQKYTSEPMASLSEAMGSAPGTHLSLEATVAKVCSLYIIHFFQLLYNILHGNAVSINVCHASGNTGALAFPYILR